MNQRDEQQRRRSGKVQKQERQDWRRKGTDASTGSTRKEVKGWFRTGQSHIRYSRYRRLLGLGICLAALLFGVCAWIYVVNRKYIQVPLLVLTVTDYELPPDSLARELPPNAYAREDEQRFANMFKGGGGKNATRNVACTLLTDGPRRGHCTAKEFLNRLQQKLNTTGFQPGGPNRDTAILYVSAHGAVNEANEACLLLSDADPLDSKTWLTVKELVKALRPEKLREDLRDCKWLVFLDASRIRENWQMGMLYNDFPDRLKAEMEGHLDERLVVVSAAGSGQTAWADPADGGTFFGRAVAEALAGKAKQRGPITRYLGLDRIDLQELKDFVNSQVQKGVRMKRASEQQPVWCLYTKKQQDGTKQDDVIQDGAPQFAWKIAEIPRQELEVPENDTKSRREAMERHGRETAALWNKADEWATTEPYLADPCGWADIQTRLVRLEQLALAGAAYDDTYQAEHDSLNSELSTSGWRDLTSSSVSSVDAQTTRKRVDRVPREHLVTSLPLIDLVRPLASTEVSQALPANSASADPGGTAAPPAPPSYAECLVEARSLLARMDPPTRDVLKTKLSSWEKSRTAARKTDPVEIAFARLVVEDVMTEPNGEWDSSLAASVGKTLRCRLQAEKAAAPADPRAVAWIAAQVQRADQERRQAEDLLLQMEPKPGLSTTEFDAIVDSALNRYAAAIELGEVVSNAFRVRDRVCAQLVGLAHWSLHGPLRTRSPEVADNGAAQKSQDEPASAGAALGRNNRLERLLQLVKDTHGLSDLLAAPNDKWELNSEPFKNLTTRLREVSLSVDTARQESWDDFWSFASNIGNVDNADTLRQCADILNTPCGGGTSQKVDKRPAGTSRGNVFDKYVRKLLSLGDLTTPESPPAPDILARVAASRIHPALAILQKDAPLAPPASGPGSGLGIVKENEQRIREELARRILADVKSESSEALQLSDVADRSDPMLASSLHLQIAERRLRPALPLSGLASRPQTAYAPLMARDVAMLRLFMWHRLRTLEDCYLLPATSPATGVSYVAAASQGYGRITDELWGDISENIPADLKSNVRQAEFSGTVSEVNVLQRAEQRERAQPIAVRTLPIELDDRDEQLVGARLEEAVSHDFDVVANADLPAGQGFWELRERKTDGAASGSAEVVRVSGGLAEGEETKNTVRARHRLGTPVSEAKYDLKLSRDQLRGTTALDLATYFRGGWTRETMPVRPPGRGLEIISEHLDYSTPQITVTGDQTKPVLIMIVLDCSSSMSEVIPGEAKTETKMEQAKEALRLLLERLLVIQNETQGSYRVGLILFGHRVNEDELTKKLVDPDGKPADTSVGTPNEDVQVVFSLKDSGKLSRELADRMLDRVKALARPHGLTPLYLSLETAIRDIAASGVTEASARHVIAITDGADTYYAKWGGKRVLAENVIELSKKPPQLRLDVIGFGFQEPSGNTPEPPKIQEIRRVAKAFGGDLHPASGSLALREKLQEAVKPWDVIVQQPDAGKPDTKKDLGGTPWQAPDWEKTRKKYVLTVVDPLGRKVTPPYPVELEGGEHLRLEFDGKQLVNLEQRYNSQDPRENINGYYVDAVEPEWKSNVLAFRVLLRNKDLLKFTPQPKRVWAEISPVSATQEETPKVYCFYDLEFREDRPFPELLFRTTNWPDSLLTARIRFWAAMQDVKPTAMSWVVTPPGKKGERVPFDDMDVTLRMKELRDDASDERIYVIHEIYGSQATPENIPELRVQLDPTPSYSSHEIVARENRVRHEFRYRAQGSPQRVLVTRKREIQSGADIVIDDRPLEVRTPRKGE